MFVPFGLCVWGVLTIYLFQKVLRAEVRALPPRDIGLGDGDASARLRVPPELLHVHYLQQDADHGWPLRHEGQPGVLPAPLRDAGAGTGLSPPAQLRRAGSQGRRPLLTLLQRHRYGTEGKAAEEEEPGHGDRYTQLQHRWERAALSRASPQEHTDMWKHLLNSLSIVREAFSFNFNSLFYMNRPNDLDSGTFSKILRACYQTLITVKLNIKLFFHVSKVLLEPTARP